MCLYVQAPVAARREYWIPVQLEESVGFLCS